MPPIVYVAVLVEVEVEVEVDVDVTVAVEVAVDVAVDVVVAVEVDVAVVVEVEVVLNGIQLEVPPALMAVSETIEGDCPRLQLIALKLVVAVTIIGSTYSVPTGVSSGFLERQTGVFPSVV